MACVRACLPLQRFSEAAAIGPRRLAHALTSPATLALLPAQGVLLLNAAGTYRKPGYTIIPYLPSHNLLATTAGNSTPFPRPPDHKISCCVVRSAKQTTDQQIPTRQLTFSSLRALPTLSSRYCNDSQRLRPTLRPLDLVLCSQSATDPPSTRGLHADG